MHKGFTHNTFLRTRGFKLQPVKHTYRYWYCTLHITHTRSSYTVHGQYYVYMYARNTLLEDQIYPLWVQGLSYGEKIISLSAAW